jgi:glucosamine-phosphate N-acetyltransferase
MATGRPIELPQGWSHRVAEPSDIDRGHLDVLRQLTVAPDLTRERYSELLGEMAARGSHVEVVIDASDAIVASATLLVERKLARNGGLVGHIEDVVVDDRCRGKGIGVFLIQRLSDLARTQGCYKVILDCSDANAGFYERCGYGRKEVQMRLDL